MPIATSASANVPTSVAAPVWSGSQTVNATVGDSGAIDLSALCAGTGITYSLQAGTLPSGRSLSGSSITGTYTTAQSATYTIRATNAGGFADRVFTYTISAASTLWLSPSTQTISLLTTDSGQIDLDPYTSGAYTHTADQLPSGFTRAGARGQLLNYGSLTAQSITSVFTADDGAGGGTDDFAARAAAANAFSTWRFNTQADVLNYVHPDSAQSQVVWDDAIKPPGAGGSLRHNILAGDTTNSGNWKRHLHPSQIVFGNGSTYYIQWREYFDSVIMFLPHPGTLSGFAAGFKQINLAEYGYSNTNAEVVMQNLHQIGAPQIYHRDTGGSYPQIVTLIPSGPSYRWQNAVDNGGPDTTLDQRLARYGPVYGMPTNLNPAPDTRSGGLNYYAGEWMTFEIRVTLGTIGVSAGNSTVEMWAARANQAPKKLVSATNLDIGAGTNVAGHDAAWINAYCSDKTGGQAGVMRKSDYIIAPQPIAFPGGFSITTV